MAKQPKPVWVTVSEGDFYIPWKEWTLEWTDPGNRWEKLGGKHKFLHHSVGFDNGWVFDGCGGWRKWYPKMLPAEMRAKLGLPPLKKRER